MAAAFPIQDDCGIIDVDDARGKNDNRRGEGGAAVAAVAAGADENANDDVDRYLLGRLGLLPDEVDWRGTPTTPTSTTSAHRSIAAWDAHEF